MMRFNANEHTHTQRKTEKASKQLEEIKTNEVAASQEFDALRIRLRSKCEKLVRATSTLVEL